MKFQNPSLKFSFNGPTHRCTDGRTSRNQYAPHFFKVGGINKKRITVKEKRNPVKRGFSTKSCNNCSTAPCA